MSTCAPSAQTFFCPTKWQLWRQIIALLPRGRAWQTHEGPVYGATEAGDPDVDTLTVMEQFWAAYAEVLEYLHQRACALIEEFFCETMQELRPEWFTEWGFPDPCEPFDNVCEKMRATGGNRCEYFVALAAARGWSLECIDCASLPDVAESADCMAADCSSPSCDDDCGPDTIILIIHTAESPAYVSPLINNAADCMAADCSSLCDPTVAPLQCLIERVRPAHTKVIYRVL